MGTDPQCTAVYSRCVLTLGKWNKKISHPLNHNAVDAHVAVSSGEVEQINPAQSHAENQEGKILLQPAEIQPHTDYKEHRLK